MRFDGDFNGFDPRSPRPEFAPPPGRERGPDRPPSLPQADGDPEGGSPSTGARKAGRYPPGSYGELNYRDEDSPRGVASARGRFAGRGPKGFRRSDARVLEDVSEALARHGDVDASEIEVRAEAGEVTLDGSVSDRRAKWLAEDCVLAVPGVRDVRNNLRIVRSPNP